MIQLIDTSRHFLQILFINPYLKYLKIITKHISISILYVRDKGHKMYIFVFLCFTYLPYEITFIKFDWIKISVKHF